MAVNVSKNSGDTTFTFEVTGLSTKLDPLLDSWANYVWTHGFGLTEEVDDETVAIEFEDATNSQKMSAINKRLKKLGRDEANTMEAIKSKEAADEDKVVYDEIEEGE